MPATMTHWRKAVTLLVAGLALAGCSSSPFGGPKRAQPVVTVDPNLYPANYRQQITALLLTQLHQRPDFFNTMISPPVLKPVAESTNLRYVVCLQFNARLDHRNKGVIFLGGSPTQDGDATPQQCGDAAYGPFPELQAVFPGK
jgi:hypothetical protein